MTALAPIDHPIATQTEPWYMNEIAVAPPWLRGTCWAVNVTLVLAAVAVGAALEPVWAAGLGAIVIGWEIIDLLRSGRSAGHRITQLRTVDRTTRMPGTLATHLDRRCLTADLRRGPDPLVIQPRTFTRPGPSPTTPPSRPSHGGAFILSADDGSRITITSPTLVGRLATDPTGRYAVARIPDVSKTLSRNHALLEPTAAGLQVTDVGSGNGSAIETAAGRTWIGHHQTVTVGHGTRLLLGTRFFEVTYE